MLYRFRKLYDKEKNEILFLKRNQKTRNVNWSLIPMPEKSESEEKNWFDELCRFFNLFENEEEQAKCSFPQKESQKYKLKS